MKKLDYDPELYIEYALKLLEGDVCFLSSKYYINGYDQEDLQQELRLHLWIKLKHYNHDKAGLRAWGNQVMRNRLKDLLRTETRKKRGVMIELTDNLCGESVDLDALIDKFDEKGERFSNFL